MIDRGQKSSLKIEESSSVSMYSKNNGVYSSPLLTMIPSLGQKSGRGQNRSHFLMCAATMSNLKGLCSAAAALLLLGGLLLGRLHVAGLLGWRWGRRHCCGR